MKKILKVTHRGYLKILNKEIPCAVLENGQRIISQTGLFKSFDRPRKGEKRLEKLPSVVGAKNLLKYVTEELYEKSEVVEYYHTNGKVAQGYNAEIIPLICELYIEAYNNNSLTTSQLKLYERSILLIRALAKVGITALIDEATGYQYDRQAQELQELLKAYISEDLLKWQKRFPNKYYREIFRLYGWEYDENSSKRPGFVGTFTKMYIYDLFPEEVIKEIEKRNPIVQNQNSWSRRKRHHQFLTTDIGIPQLDHYISKLLGVMALSDNKEEFKKNFKKAFDEEIKLKEAEKEYKNKQMELFPSELKK
jgi:phage protein|nr:MAG TPA: P63C domain protein [Caudoviricetes sp.]